MSPLSRIARPVVFPLRSLTADGSCTCIQGAACTRAGKHSAVAWGSVTLTNPAPRPAPGAGYGVRTGAAPEGSGVIVVDLDSEEAADAWEAMGGHFDTFTVSTPRGFHVYFNHPGFPVGNSAGQLAKGIDIRGDGGFVVGPGSPHKSGGLYSVGNDLPLADIPDCLLEWLKSRPQQKEIAHYSGDVEPGTPEHAYRRRLYTEYLTNEAEVCTQGEGGDPALFPVVQRGAYDLGLPTSDVLELIREHYDPRCSPPWGDELEARVLHKAHDAKTKSTREAMIPWPEDIAVMLAKPRHERLAELAAAPIERITDADLVVLKAAIAAHEALPRDAAQTELGNVLGVLGRLVPAPPSRDGSRTALCPCGAHATLSRAGRFRCYAKWPYNQSRGPPRSSTGSFQCLIRIT